MTGNPHERRYTVSGIDEEGDVQAFATHDRQAADDVREQMEAELSDVRFTDSEA